MSETNEHQSKIEREKIRIKSRRKSEENRVKNLHDLN
jgi:hypothetical protein